MDNISNVNLYFAKFLTCITIHIVGLRYFNAGLAVMKYTSNHPEKFENPNICYVLALLRVVNFLVIETTNFFILESKPTVPLALGAFVTEAAVILFPNYYQEEIIGFSNKEKLRECLYPENAPPIEWNNRDHAFGERTFVGKIQRLLYKLLRMFYVVFLYYFEVNIYLILNSIRRESAEDDF